MALTLSVAFRLGRVSNLPTVWTNVLAGVMLSGAAFTGGAVALLIAALSLFYVAGMYFNDAFDAGYDARTRPGRPIPSGVVTARAVFMLGGAMMLVALLLLASLPARSGGLLAALGLVIAIIVYDAWHKANPFGPVVMGLCRLLVYVIAALSLTDAPDPAVYVAALVALSYLIGLTYAAKQEDLTRMGSLWPLLFLAAPLLYGVRTAAEGGVGLAAYLALAAVILWSVWLMMRPGPKAIGKVVALLIAGICLLDALFVAGAGQPGWAVLAMLGFVVTLAAQRIIPGT
ncbi:UbiA family prenyltransferase [Sphingomonas quercus]|uniref:UbiA family prenyltransferase n=1 Tax=Sphingomonas quercus TaxID=2842451 RepID=A0ABS6BNZ7_9SPHN|nr:UbiA family prenyltransferase [Sphingomonas quercus]MBU3078984.1 UbiA family prenyltransferase [Sphingomonas quercus]